MSDPTRETTGYHTPHFDPDCEECAYLARPTRQTIGATTPAPLDVEVRERWLARVEWNGSGKRASWRCLVCGQYDKHRADATDYCPIARVLAALEGAPHE